MCPSPLSIFRGRWNLLLRASSAGKIILRFLHKLRYCVPGMSGDTKFLLWLLLLSSSSPCFGSKPDIQCLKDVLQSVVDPKGVLKSSWNFDNRSSGSICHFTGVECWHRGENSVLALRLSNLGLGGQFPRGLENCKSMVVLDLSSNEFSGSIPSDISRQLPLLTSLDLSYNGFSGEIPGSVTHMTHLTSLDLSYNTFSGEIPFNITKMPYLNVLLLQHNQLSGQIPWQFGPQFSSQIPRTDGNTLPSFNVADNKLSGPIPSIFGEMYPSSNFTGNPKLCGAPMGDCKRNKLPRINDASSIGAAAGFIVGFVVAFYFPRLFVCSRRLRPHFVHIVDSAVVSIPL